MTTNDRIHEIDKVNPGALGQQAPQLAARAGFEVPPATKLLVAPLPSDLDRLASHPLVRERLVPVLGRPQQPNRPAACRLPRSDHAH